MVVKGHSINRDLYHAKLNAISTCITNRLDADDILDALLLAVTWPVRSSSRHLGMNATVAYRCSHQSVQYIGDKFLPSINDSLPGRLE